MKLARLVVSVSPIEYGCNLDLLASSCDGRRDDTFGACKSANPTLQESHSLYRTCKLPSAILSGI